MKVSLRMIYLKVMEDIDIKMKEFTKGTLKEVSDMV